MIKITSLKVAYSPWVFFILFLLADLLLVFAPVSLAVDLAILLFGILTPFIVALFLLKTPALGKEKDSFRQTEWFDVGCWLWVILAVLCAATSFYKLMTLPWPVPDDGYFAYWARRVEALGDWRILYGTSHVEPLFIWGLAAWFKFFQSSLLALKTFPIFVYAGILTAGYLAARQYFSKTISFMALWFLTFNFFTIFIMRQCEDALSLLLFECLSFYFLSHFLDKATNKNKSFWLFAFCIGVGFYTYSAWPVVVVMAVLPVVMRVKKDFPESVKIFFGFILVALLLSWPLILSRLLPGGRALFQRVLSGHTMGLNLDYASIFFWNGLGTIKEDPSKLGWLNPCLVSLCLIGCLELWKQRFTPMAQWIFLALLLFMLPGLLTEPIEIYHIVAVLPLICVLGALGVHSLLLKTSYSKKINLLLFLLFGVLSLGFDAYHYAGPGQLQDPGYWVRNKRHLMPVDFSRAYPLLAAAHQKGTPLFLFLNLNENNMDQTLNVVTSPFDETGRTEFLKQDNQKAVLLVNANYETFLKKEIPDSDWIWLSPDLSNDGGGLMLGFVRINASDLKTLTRWAKANDVLKRNNDIYMDPVSNQADETLKDLYAHYAVFQGDRFLESVFWEKIAFYEVYRNKIPEAVAALKNGEQKGYPSAQVFNQLGELFAFFGKKDEAEVYFKKAIGCTVNRTTAEENLKHLQF
jgi:hypothetical protein